MTIQTLHGAADRLTIRYFPVLVWIFVLLIGYGVASIGYELSSGLRPIGLGPLLAIALLVGLAAVAILTGGALVVCTFDRSRDQLLVRRFGLRGQERVERRLSEVVAIEVRVLRRSQHRVELGLRSGERLPLTPYYVVSLFGTGGISRLSALLGIEPTFVQQAPKIWR